MRRGADASVHSTAHAIVPGTCFMGRDIREQSQHEAKEKSCFVCLFMKLNYELRSSILQKHCCLPISSISCVDWKPASQPILGQYSMCVYALQLSVSLSDRFLTWPSCEGGRRADQHRARQ